MSPKVSIIVPNYNHAKFLEERLSSIFNQTYRDFEVILLDDQSTDHSKAILEKYSTFTEVSHVVYNEKNSGSPFSQWQKGISLAKGELIWIAESDDFCELNFLEKLVPLFSEKENLGLAYARSNNVDEDGNFNEDFWPDGLNNLRWRASYYNTGEDEIRNYLKFRNTIPNASACVFKKHVFDFEEIKNMYFAGDWLFWTKMLAKSDVFFCNEVLNHFRFHSKTTRSVQNKEKTLKKYKEYLHVLMWIYDYTKEEFTYNRNHQWIYNELNNKKISLLYLYNNLRPFFYTYSQFRYKLIKHQIRKKLFRK